MSFQPHYILLDAGTVEAGVITDANGPRPDYSNIGDLVFFIDVVELNGGRLGLWSGLSYEEAIRQAEDARCDFGIEEAVHDVIGGAA